MIQIRYFCPGGEHLPEAVAHTPGLRIRTVMEENAPLFLTMVEFDLSEFTFFINRKAASLDAALADGDVLYIMKPSAGG